MSFLKSNNFTFTTLLILSTFLSSFINDNTENNDSENLNDIPCKYTLEYSNSDSNFNSIIYIEYYSPIEKKNLKDTINGKGYWESPSMAFNFKDSVYFKIIAKTSSFNHMISTTFNQKLVPIDDKIKVLFNIDYKTNSNKYVIISGKRTILTDIKTLTGVVQFPKK
jgi:hypothetical protein